MKHSTFVFSLVLFAALVGGFVQGCGGDKLTLGLPDGDVVPWGESIKVLASISEQGNKPSDGSKVSFSTTVGSFEPYDGASVTTLVQAQDATTSAGSASIELYSFPGEGGKTGLVSASYTTINGVGVTGEVTVTIAEGGLPSGKFLSAQCDADNVQALDAQGDPNQDMKVRCIVTVKDIRGEPVPIADVSYVVEEGCTLSRNQGGSTAGEHVFTLIPDCKPAEVDPMNGEPNHNEQGVIHNPRDGLLTILFHLRGQEGFTDTNRNGIYDPGEGFVGQDLPEPFLDANDDGVWTPDETFIDTNEDGLWNPADGRWNEATEIWTVARVLFSGPPHESVHTTRFEPSGISVDDSGEQTLILYLMDENHNPIAAHNDNDTIDFYATDVNVKAGDDDQRLISGMGVEFGDSGINVETFNQGRSYQVTLVDHYPGDPTPRSVTLATTIDWTPAPKYDGYYPVAASQPLNVVTGTAN
jgi:hypothetical protein